MTQLQSGMEQVQALTHRVYLEGGGIPAMLDSTPHSSASLMRQNRLHWWAVIVSFYSDSAPNPPNSPKKQNRGKA